DGEIDMLQTKKETINLMLRTTPGKLRTERAVIRFAALALWLILTQSLSLAQETAPQPLRLDQAVEQALSNYPAIRAARAATQAADEGIGLARTSYLPRADLLWQENRATRNNVFGLLLPQSTIPAISGPVL